MNRRKLQKVEDKNDENLSKMVIVSEVNTVKKSKALLNQEALAFKNNVEDAINLLKEQQGEPQISDRLVLERMMPKGKQGQRKLPESLAGARYECIYKNMLRELKQYYTAQFRVFL